MTPIFLSLGNWLYQKVYKPQAQDSFVSNSLEMEILYVNITYGTVNFNLADIRNYNDLMQAGFTEPDNDELLRLLQRKH